VRAQRDFDEKYITSSEVCQQMGITRTGLIHARRAGRLPDPITVTAGGQVVLMLWERAELAPVLLCWSIERAARGCPA